MTIPIIADHRESRSAIIKALQKVEDVIVTVQELDCGDYVLGNNLVVERKSAVDFVASIMDRRLFGQVELMMATYERLIFIVEGDVFSTRSAITHDALRGALSYLVAIKGAAFMPSKNTEDTAALLTTMARHVTHGLGYEVALRAGKPKDLNTQAQYLVEGFPGVGPAGAKALLKHFGSVQKILEADVATLRNAPGVGPKTAKLIRAVIEANYTST